MMELYLSSDGKHTVHVTGEGADDLFKSLPQAKMLYEAVVKAYGTKGSVRCGHPEGEAEKEDASVHGQAPLCPVHNAPMAYREGKYGPFWSCPRRLPDGSWCQCTIDARDESNDATPIA